MIKVTVEVLSDENVQKLKAISTTEIRNVNAINDVYNIYSYKNSVMVYDPLQTFEISGEVVYNKKDNDVNSLVELVFRDMYRR